MTLWWLEPGWKQARCPNCGGNIWDSGGDPDWGRCYECMNEPRGGEPEPRYKCDICATGEACASSNGFAVCSQECSDVAASRINAAPKEADHG